MNIVCVCVCVKFYEILDSSNYCHSQETELFPHLNPPAPGVTF